MVDPSLYCSLADVRAEGFTDTSLYPDARINYLIPLASRYVDKMTGRWFYPKNFMLANPPTTPSSTLAASMNGLILPQATIQVANAGGFNQTGGVILVTTSAGVQTVAYKNLDVTGTLFTGCSGGLGTMATGGLVASALVYPTVNLLPGNLYPVPTQLNLQPGDVPYKVNGNGRRDLITSDFEIPICRLDALGIENQAFLFSQLTWIELSAVRVYNRHLLGQLQPDDRENPQIGFTVAGRIVETIASGLYPAPRIYPHGRLNCFLFGAFGYTDPDPAGLIPEGITPPAIRRATVLLVLRDIITEANRAKKLAFRDMYRIIGDKEGSTDVTLQQMWIRGGFTGDPDIDTVLRAYSRPPRFGAA